MHAAKSCKTLIPDEPLSMPLHPAEARLLQHVRALVFGSIHVQIQNGVPVFIDEIREKIKLV
jgi:hypothetical protein